MKKEEEGGEDDKDKEQETMKEREEIIELLTECEISVFEYFIVQKLMCKYLVLHACT